MTRARALLEAQLALPPSPEGSDYRALDDAVAAALRGDAAAAATLWRVFNERGFAVSNSCNEVGLAGLALALLGDRAVIPHLRRAMRINFTAVAVPVALELLGER